MNKQNTHKLSRLLELFLVSSKLGITSFGGPTAHLGYFHEEYVRKRRWLDEKTFADLVALCQFLPGPASSQVGIGIGVMRAGIVGGIVSFLGFTLPSVLILILFALLVNGLHVQLTGWIHGLKLVAVAIVAHAILGMAKSLTPDLKRKAIALSSLIIALLWQTTYTQVGIILFTAVLSFFLFSGTTEMDVESVPFPISKNFGLGCLSLFFGLLLVLPILRATTSSEWLALFDSFYRSGALVFGGGHVVLPLLEREVVPIGWLNKETFLAGYGAAQAIPGPLFTFASYLGTAIKGVTGGILVTIAIFLPAFLLVYGTLPFWSTLRQNPKIRGILMGVNASVIGLLIASFYQPIWESSVLNSMDFAIASLLFSLLAFWKVPPWIIVLLGALLGLLLT